MQKKYLFFVFTLVLVNSLHYFLRDRITNKVLIDRNRKCLLNMEKQYNEIDKYVDLGFISGVAKRHPLSKDLDILVCDKLLIKIKKKSVEKLYKGIKHDDEFNISFILNDRITLRVVTIGNNVINQKSNMNYEIIYVY